MSTINNIHFMTKDLKRTERKKEKNERERERKKARIKEKKFQLKKM